MFSLGIVGAGQFAGQFAKLFMAHPGVRDVHVTDVLPDRAEQLCADQGLTGTFPSYEADARLRRRRRRRDLHPALDARPPCRSRRSGREARVLGRAHGHHRRRDRRDHRRCQGDRPDLHDGRDQPVQPGDRVRPQPDRRGRVRPALLRRGRLRARHGPRLLRGVPVQRRRAVEGDRQLPAHALPDARHRRRTRGVADARGQRVRASASPTTAATACSTRRSASSTTTSPTRPRCSRSPAADHSAPTSSAASATRRTSGNHASASSAPRPASSSWPRLPSGRTSRRYRGDQRAAGAQADAGRRRPLAGRTSRPTLRDAFTSGSAPVHDREPASARVRRDSTTGTRAATTSSSTTSSRAVNAGTLPPVNAWVAARYTLPGIVAHESARLGGARLAIPDFGDAPAS